MPPARVEHRSGPARFEAFSGMPVMQRMPPLNSERPNVDGRRCDLATFTRIVVSKKEKAYFVEKQTKMRGDATPGHTAFKDGRLFFKNQSPPQGQR